MRGFSESRVTSVVGKAVALQLVVNDVTRVSEYSCFPIAILIVHLEAIFISDCSINVLIGENIEVTRESSFHGESIIRVENQKS